MDKNKPTHRFNKNKAINSKSHQTDWVKKLEAASGKPLQSISLPKNSDTEATVPEKLRIQFKCAKTGRLFFVFLTRHSSSHAFHVTSVSKETKASLNHRQDHSLPSSSLTHTSFEASDFDWTGWFCPYCMHSDTFVKCPQCLEIVCGGRVRQHQNGTKSFACYNECGHSGEIEGYIDSFSGSKEHIPKSSSSLLPRHRSHVKSLPPPTKNLRLPSNEPEP